MTKPNRLPNENDPLCQYEDVPPHHFIPLMKSRPQKYCGNEHKGLAVVTQITVSCIGGCGKTKTMVPSHVPEGGWRCLDCYNLAQTSDELARWESYAHGIGIEPTHRPGIGACTLFTGTPTKDGYGAFHLSGGGQIQAHIYAWILASGSVPKGRYVCHRCDKRDCIRTDPPGSFMLNGREIPCLGHLFLGSKPDNTEDMVSKDRQAKGEDNGLAKLTEEIVREFRLEFAAGGVTQTELARRLGVTQASISSAILRKTWQHVR